MMLSKDAIADVVEIVRTADFYRPAHATIFDAILDLYGRGEPADAITVVAALADSGDLARVGGVPYVHDLLAIVPTAANASYYGRIVAERAVLRRLVEAGTRIVQLGYGAAGAGGRDVDDTVDLAQQEIYNVTERRGGDDFAILSELLQPTLDEIEAVGAQGGVMTGIPTGFSDLDRLLNGLHGGQLIIVAGRPGLGKALALDTPLPTPTGWTTMGAVREGDQLLDADGRPTTVLRAFDVMHGRSCYEVEFSDGSVIVADADHLWKVSSRASRRQAGEAGGSYRSSESDRLAATSARSLFVESARGASRVVNAETTAAHPAVLTTAEIAKAVRHPTDGRANYAVPAAAALDLPDKADLPIPPYTLGVWLGDGRSKASRFTSDRSAPVLGAGDARRCRASHVTHGSFAGVFGDEHIPMAYLRASRRQRRALLAGLMDTDGTVSPSGALQYTTTVRRLADDVRELVITLGYRAGLSTRKVRGRSEASSTAYTVTFSTTDEVFRLGRKRLAHGERMRRAGSTSRDRYIVAVRSVASVPVRCVTVDNDDHLYLAGRTMVPTHNSTAGMDFVRAASVKHNLASAIFSLEMSKVEIVMRLLSAEARVPLHVLRSGQLSDDDWTKLARRMGEISEAPLFVDDTPSMTLMEIRAKARRLKQRNDLKLIVVDYLQLMTSPKRTESRQQEVAELSRGLKLLAKEVECPVVAVSQLNRGPEQRTDKRPQLSDLRESGCLTADTRVVRADTNAEVSLGDLLASGERDIPIWALDERLKYVPRTMTHVFPSGRKPVFRMRLRSGKEIEATANHPFLTIDGWRALGTLGTGSRLAVPRHVPGPLEGSAWSDDEVVLLAHLLGDGSFVRRQPIRYASVDESNLAAVTGAARHFGVTAVLDDYPAARVKTLRLPAPFPVARGRRNPIAEWLDGMGLFGLRSHEKFIPDAVFGLGKRQVTLFLHHLWATDGSVTVRGNGGRVYFSSTSRRLIDGVASLLLRFGISGRIKAVQPEGYRTQYTLDISGRDDQLRFLREISVHGGRSASCLALLALLEKVRSNTNVDTVPREVWDRVRTALADQQMTHREFAAATGTQFCGSTLWKHAPGRERLSRVAAVLGNADLELLATNDVLWDEVVSIDPIGEQEVYDATVLGLHNFIANGIAVHNSIEQDADVVILLHRDDYYDKESPRAGEADFIVAKHRNGPTDTITVAAQLHLSRFVDMAIT
jgi:replicative DNA helicase